MNRHLSILAASFVVISGGTLASDTDTFSWHRLAPDAGAIEEATVILGRALSNTPMDIDVCAENEICMSAWFHFEIAVDRVVAGKKLGRSVRAARLQHMGLYGIEDKVALMVLSPIDDESERQRLGVNYYLIDYSFADPLYCIGMPLDRFGFSGQTPPLLDGESYCYEPGKVAP